MRDIFKDQGLLRGFFHFLGRNIHSGMVMHAMLISLRESQSGRPPPFGRVYRILIDDPTDRSNVRRLVFSQILN